MVSTMTGVRRYSERHMDLTAEYHRLRLVLEETLRLVDRMEGEHRRLSIEPYTERPV